MSTPRRIARNALIALDQLANALLAGWPDETLSCRAWRCRNHRRRWAVTRRLIDGLFFWEPDHCQGAYMSEQARNHLPPALRGSAPSE